MPTSPDPARRGPRLRIVAINDVYSLENLPRLRGLVARHAEVDPADATIVALAGDFLAPSMLSSLDAGAGMVDCLDAVGVTHVTLGNHEDDVPVAELRRRIRELRAVWLATNVRGLDPALRARDVVEVVAPGGRAVRVGVVGVVMDDPSVYRGRPFGGADVQPANLAALTEAARLVRDDGCACVVPLTHQTLAEDRALAEADRGARFPVILGGHEHDPHLEQVHGTWIVKTGSEAERAAVVDLAWPAEAPRAGEPDRPEVRVRLEPVSGYPDDPAVRARVEAHMARVHALETAVLFTLAPGQTLSSVGTRREQTSMGTLVCTLLRRALGADAAIFNGGGIRAARTYREHLTYGDVKAEIPFDNEVVVARMPGRVLGEAIAFSRAHAPEEFGGFLQVDDGVRLEAGRVARVAGAPFDPARDYRVALVRNFFVGMDGIEPLVRFARERPERVPPPDSGRETKEILVGAMSLALWHRLGGFDAVDRDHDGHVTPDEVAAAVARATGAPASPITVELVLGAIDRDHDRVVEREEVAAAEPTEPG